MFVNFFHELKAQNVPVSLREYLSLLEALDSDVINNEVLDFYYLSKAALVKGGASSGSPAPIATSAMRAPGSAEIAFPRA